ncbi:MAG TPA: 3-hydroxyacyl-ACP dehydratase FabZ [Rhodocyclaceae bacterium]|nr:3-hydroxyacyl-ACP dehydratase FabZ [Rhodocyclaceae bacterium]
MNIKQIMEYLPHRYPFLLVDRIVECEPGKRIVALKNVTMNEPFFTGHFPHYAVMPGVLVIEAMAQAAAILSFKSMGIEPDDKSVYYFAGIDKARFKRPVHPGDQLLLEVSAGRVVRGVGRFTGVARVDGQLAAEADMLCVYRPIP